MLKKFTVSNFKTFNTPVCLDFTKVSQYEFNTECVDSEAGIVTKAIAYGYNGSGKSSISTALFDIVSNVTDNYPNKVAFINYQNILSKKNYAEFTYEFFFLGKTLIYTYKKEDLFTILAERISIDGKTILDYDKTKSNELYIEIDGTEDINNNIEDSKISFVKYIRSHRNLPDTENNKVLKVFFTFVDKMLLFWSLTDRSFVGYTTEASGQMTNEIVKNGHFDDFANFLKEAGIKEKISHASIDGNERFYFTYGKEKLPFKYASTGTATLLLLYFWLQNLQDESKAPSFICIDEFDAFYHFELAKLVVKKIKKAKCQVLLTTHNTSLMSNSILRPDCYYLVYKDHIENLSNCTEKELRQAHNIEKLYRAHAFE